nr:hypothetical protein [Leptospira interrogans]
MCVFNPKTRPLGERFAEFNFDSKILLTCGVGYGRERCAEFNFDSKIFLNL